MLYRKGIIDYMGLLINTDNEDIFNPHIGQTTMLRKYGIILSAIGGMVSSREALYGNTQWTNDRFPRHRDQLNSLIVGENQPKPFLYDP
jgi:hypothetical protein